MNRTDKQIPQIFRSPDHPELYPFWARAIAGLIRLGIGPLFMGFGISKKMLEVFGPVPTYALEEIERSPALYAWLSFLLALLGLAGYSLLTSLIYSMELLEIAHEIPWGLMVSNYVFWVGTSTGLCVLASLGYVFGYKRYELISRRCLFMAIITIIFGMSSIMLHLGHPERPLIYSALSPNPLSSMWWMGTVYPIYILFLIVTYWFLARVDLAKTATQSIGLKAVIYHILVLGRVDVSKDAVQWDMKWARIVGALALASGLFAYSIEGTLFAHTEARPLWYGAIYSPYFLLAAALCGCAFLLIAEITTNELRGKKMSVELKELLFEIAKILAFLTSISIILTTCKMAFGVFESSAKAEIIMLLLTGPFSVGFWLFEILVGALLPMFILLGSVKRKNMDGVLFASVMVVIGTYILRYNFVVAAQVYPVLREGLPSYLPGIMEILLVSGLIGGILLAYTLGELFLPLKGRAESTAPFIERGEVAR